MAEDVNLTGELSVTVTEDDPRSAEDKKAQEDAASDQADDTKADTVATVLATGLTLLTAGLGIFGGLTGSVARMARNHEQGAAIAIGLVLLSVVLALASRLVQTKTKLLWFIPHAYRLLLWLALACFVAGIAIALHLLNTSLGTDDRPSIATTTVRDAAGGVTISGTAKAGGLAVDDRIDVVVVAYGAEAEPAQVYYSQVGANQDGLVDHTFSVIVDPDTSAVLITVAANQKADEQITTCEPPAPPAAEEAPPAPGDVPTPPNRLTACALVEIGARPTPVASQSVDPSDGPNEIPGEPQPTKMQKG